MRIHVDVTEPGFVVREVISRATAAGFPVERTILHKRRGLGASLTERHPFYGGCGDYLVLDDRGTRIAAIERKTRESLARAGALQRDGERPKIFRQLHDLGVEGIPFLILEGRVTPLYRTMEPMIVGLQLRCAAEGIGVISTTGPAASANAIVLMTKRFATLLETDRPHRVAGPEDAAIGPATP